MITDPMILYKLMILYLLRQANLPISNEQICEFFLSKDYTTYLNLQQALGEMLDAKLISSTRMRDSFRYEITSQGVATLNYFGGDISDSIKEDIHNYLRSNRLRLRNEVGINASYKKSSGNDYDVTCELREGPLTLMTLTISVPGEGQARVVCDRWQNASQEIYSTVMEELLKEI